MPNGLYLHSSCRLEDLSSMLAALVKAGGRLDPLAPDIVVVQTPGVARWLSLRLADTLGCAMGVSYLFPRNFVDWATAALLGGKTPAHPDRGVLAWRIFALLPEISAMPGADALSGYLASGSPLRRRQLSLRLADLFDSYLVFRPELVESWENGSEGGDWQAELWRRIAAGMPVAHLASLMGEIENAAPPPDFPRRIHLFALSTLPELYVKLLASLGKVCEVHLLSFSPCAQYWGDIPGRRAEAAARASGDISDFGQPLLSSMGLQGRDFLDQLLEAGFVEIPGSFPSPGASTELNRLQEEIVRLQPRHEAGAPDDSIEVVSCAGPMREVEVLKDRLLALFEKDGTLRPRDVLVLAPDISVYAPCIEAVFGGGDGKDFIPFAVADRKVTELPAVDAFLRLLALANSRRTLRDILSFAEHPAIAARFGMAEGEIAAARDILAQTNVRWGLDESDREALGFGRVALNSWKAGVDSLALGAMMEPGALFGEVSAYGPAEGEILALAGRMAALFDSTRKALALLAEPRPLAGWPAALSEAAGLVLPTGDAESGCGLVHEAIGRLGESAELAGPDPVDCRVIADAMQGILAESYAPPGFLSGGVTFAELKPMRSIPARIMCLLGMNDAAFPRQDRPLSFDRSTRERRRGDRSIREGDRYLFLETLLCARERLYISFGGLSQRGAAETPPSVVVSELLEYLSPGHASSRIVRHPLQSFSRQYFSGGRFFSYSRMDYEAALAGLRPAPERPFFAAEAVPPSEMPQLVDFDDLDRAFRHPARFFAGGILGLRRPCAEESAACDEPVEIAAPERSVECERMVAALLSGGGVEAICRSARARGILPWGLSGESAAAETGNEALVFSNAVRPLVASPVSRLEGEFTLDRAGLVLRGRLAPVHDGVLVRMRTARIRAVDRLSLWLAALLAGAMKELGTDGSQNFRCCTLVCRDASLSIRVPDQALKRLEGIAGLYLKGLHSPLPFFPETSLEYVREGGRSKRSPLERALGVWTGGNFPESADPWNALVWRGREPVSAASGFTDAAVILWNGYFDCAEESQT